MNARNLKSLGVLGLVVVGVLMLSGSVSAYNISGTVCTCNSCDDCTNALNDDNCTMVKLTADIINHNETCITSPQNFNNKTFDCQGHTIDGNLTEETIETYGIYLLSKQSDTIKNCIITNFEDGIYIAFSSNISLINTTIRSNWNGIYIFGNSNNNLILNNTISNNGLTGISIADFHGSSDVKSCIINKTQGTSAGTNNSNGNASHNQTFETDPSEIGAKIGAKVTACIKDGKIVPCTKNTSTNETRMCEKVPAKSIGNTNNTIKDNKILDNGIGIYSNASNSTINNNRVCGNKQSDFYSRDWLSSYGDNNYCNKSNGWNDTGTTGCSYNCSTCTCTSCEECTAKLNDPNCHVVILTTDIINHTGTCIDNPENFTNKIFDCQGHSIGGDNAGELENYSISLEYGIYLKGKSGNTIKNCNITGFYAGIKLDSSTSFELTNNTLESNRQDLYVESGSYRKTCCQCDPPLDQHEFVCVACVPVTYRYGHGILLINSSGTLLRNNYVNSNNFYGIHLEKSSNISLIENIISANAYGIVLYNSSDNRLIDNNVTLNKYEGIRIYNSSNNNTLINNSVCYNQLFQDIYINNSINNNGNNNTCEKSYGWNDTGTIGCTNTCKAKEIFDVIEMLEYLSLHGQESSSNSQYCDLNDDGIINLFDVLALMDKIVIEG